MVFGFFGTGTLACAVGKEQVSCARLFSRAARCPLIPLSSLSEPRASRKDDSGDIFHADAVRSHSNAAVTSEPDHTNYVVPTHYFDRASAPALSASALS
jgi:hypothetical protein